MDEQLTVADLMEILKVFDEDDLIYVRYLDDEGRITFIKLATGMIKDGSGVLIDLTG